MTAIGARSRRPVSVPGSIESSSRRACDPASTGVRPTRAMCYGRGAASAGLPEPGQSGPTHGDANHRRFLSNSSPNRADGLAIGPSPWLHVTHAGLGPVPSRRTRVRRRTTGTWRSADVEDEGQQAEGGCSRRLEEGGDAMTEYHALREKPADELD